MTDTPRVAGMPMEAEPEIQYPLLLREGKEG